MNLKKFEGVEKEKSQKEKAFAKRIIYFFNYFTYLIILPHYLQSLPNVRIVFVCPFHKILVVWILLRSTVLSRIMIFENCGPPGRGKVAPLASRHYFLRSKYTNTFKTNWRIRFSVGAPGSDGRCHRSHCVLVVTVVRRFVVLKTGVPTDRFKPYK